MSAFAGWIEQVIAESSGKHGKGILPVPLEPLAAPEMYGDDRLFVYLRQTGELDADVTALKNAGFPVVEFPFTNPYDVGAEFFRWEIAVSVACHILGINTFDQPDVQDSKLRTIAKIKDYQATGKLAEVDLVNVGDAKSALEKFLADAKAGDFVTINAYIPRNKETEECLASPCVLPSAKRQNAPCLLALVRASNIPRDSSTRAVPTRDCSFRSCTMPK